MGAGPGTHGAAMIYQNFDLEIIRSYNGDRLTARVLDSPQGDCPLVEVKWPFDAEQESKVLGQIYGDLKQRRGRSASETSVADFGAKLFDAIFSGDIEHLYRSSLDTAHRAGQGLRVRLRLPDDSDLHGRPWEFLFDTESKEFLAVREHTPLVRYLPVAQPIPPITVEGPLRVLVAVSAPTDYPRLDTSREWTILRDALDAPIVAGQIELRRVPGRCTFDNLRDSLRHFGAHIFHFVGHGVPGALVLDQESGKGIEMEATHLRAAFPIGALPRLIVLNSCSGAISEGLPFSGLAQGFLRQGVPAVVAMQASITDDAATIFTRYFYRDLVEIGAVDTSLTEARLRMQVNGHPIEWGTPVLYMRALSGQLFQPASAPDVRPVARKRLDEPPAWEDRAPARAEPAPSHARKPSPAPEPQGAPPPPPEPGTGVKRRPRTVKDKAGAPASRPGSASASGPGAEPAAPTVPERAVTPPARPAPKPPPAAPKNMSPPVEAPKPVPVAMPTPAPVAKSITPDVPAADRMPPRRHEPIVGEPVIQPPIPPAAQPPKTSPVFTFEPEPGQPALREEAGTARPTSSMRGTAPASAIDFSRTRIYALAAGGLVVALAIAAGVWKGRSASTPSQPAVQEMTPAPIAEAERERTRETTQATTAAPLPAPAQPVPKLEPKLEPDVRPKVLASKPAPVPSSVAVDKPRPAPRPPVTAPVDKCASLDPAERGVDCLWRDQPQSETANEIPSEE